MRFPRKECFLLLVVFSLGQVSLVHGQSKAAARKRGKPRPTPASREEVQELRGTVAAQQQTINDLKGMVQRLVEANQQAAAAAQQAQASAAQARSAAGEAQNTAVQAQGAAGKAQQVADRNQAGLAEAKTSLQAVDKKVTAVGLQSGWSGEHFFLKNSDGSFKLEPWGYMQVDYRAYEGTGTPVNNFVVRRARFGLQATLGKHYEFAFLLDAADTTTGGSRIVRDFYLTAKVRPEFQLRFGQFREPFAQEELNSAAYLDFVERSLTSLLYPSPATFRSPGAMVYGDLIGGVVQYWAGGFNGKGNLFDNTTSTPEGVFRLRFYPFKKSSNTWLKGVAFGGAGTKGRSFRGATPPETSLSAQIPTRTFRAFFPQEAINGDIVRANGEMTWVKGPLAIRAEYDQSNQTRTRITAAGAASTTNLPGVVAKGYYASATYLLTREDRPENGQPNPRHPFLDKEGRGWGAWELKFRYANLQIEDGPRGTIAQRNRVDQIQTGVNWYPTKFVRYMIDFNVERLKNPITAGTPTLLPQAFLSVLQRVQFRY